MNTGNDFKYEVAFSFLQKDEAIVYQINDLLQDRIATFVYSKKQEYLVGTDGEKSFNDVFYKDSRVVALLYRDGWGKTPWTIIEETAIKNRAFSSSWDFLLVINLDKNSSLPPWIPKTYIWFDYERWKAEGAAPVIEQKVREIGGHVRPESIEDHAGRFKRYQDAVLERQQFLITGNVKGEADKEMKEIIGLMMEARERIQKVDSHFLPATGQRLQEMYEFGQDGYFLRFNWLNSAVEFSKRSLKVSIYRKKTNWHYEEEEFLMKQESFKFDRDLNGNNIWSNENKSFTSNELVEIWIEHFFKELKRQDRLSS